MVGGTANTSIRDPVMKKTRVGLGFQLSVSGVDPGFQVRGGGGGGGAAHLNKL